MTEPEYVAEMGGVAGESANGTPVIVTGMGEYGESCNVSNHVGIGGIWVAGPYEHGTVNTSAQVPQLDWVSVNLTAYDTDPADGEIKLNELVCNEILLDQIPNCKKIWVHISLVLQDFDEEAAFAQNLIPRTYFAETYPEAKWDHWPSNAYQKDYMEFDMAFELLQNMVP